MFINLISEIIYKGTEEDSDNITVYMDDGFEVRAVISSLLKRWPIIRKSQPN